MNPAKSNRVAMYSLVATFVSVLSMLSVNIMYTNHVDQERRKATSLSIAEVQRIDREWCELLVTLDEAYRKTPPTTPTGRSVADSIRHLRGDLHC